MVQIHQATPYPFGDRVNSKPYVKALGLWVRIYRRPAVLALVCSLAVACAHLDTGAVRVAVRKYGRCDVMTFIDRQTAEPSHSLVCRAVPGESSESTGDDLARVYLYCSTGEPIFVLLDSGKKESPDKKSGKKDRAGPFIEVRYRFANHPVVEGTWSLTAEKLAADSSEATLNDFARGLTVRERLVFEVGDKWASISFRGDMMGAINDFENRCATLGK